MKDNEQQAEAQQRLRQFLDGPYSIIAQHQSDTAQDRDIAGDLEILLQQPTSKRCGVPAAPQDVLHDCGDPDCDGCDYEQKFGERFFPPTEATQALTALRALRQQVEDTILVAQTEEDSEGFITAYHFKTGAIHRLLAEARK